MQKDEKTKALLDYAKECYNSEHKPTKREIREKFHLEIYNYFKNIADYHQKAGLEPSLRNYPRENAKKRIIEYLQNKAMCGIYLNRREIEKLLNIHLSTYFKNLKELYYCAGVDYDLVEKKNNALIAKARLGEYGIEEGKRIVASHIEEEVKNGWYPVVRDIQKQLGLAFYHYFTSIFEAYSFAKIEYPFNSSNFLSKQKETILTKIVEALLAKMGYEIERIAIESRYKRNKGVDLIVKDRMNNLICVEIKAFHKSQGITPREIKQLRKYIESNKCKTGILITTSTLITEEADPRIEVIDANKLINLLKMNNLDNHLQSINWIMNERVGFSDEEFKNQMKEKIINYFKKSDCNNRRKELEKLFSIDLRTYFGDRCMGRLRALADN